MIHQILDIPCDYGKAGIPRPDYRPQLHTYILDNYDEIEPERKRPAVVICPGGGYTRTSVREGEHIAIRFNALGFNAFIVKYSCAPAVFPASLLELAAAVAQIRSRADEWHVAADKIVVAGFSAGGHLAASLGVFWNRELPCGPLSARASFSLVPEGRKPADLRPDALLLCYPVISSGVFAHRGSFEALLGDRSGDKGLLELVSLEKQVTSDTPPSFIWHTCADQSVPVENSLLFASALRRSGVPFELHIYEPGHHGLSAANEETSKASGQDIQKECQNWIDLAGTWIRNR